ncbi:hypothetical protein SCA6_012715 [Theobroma cacao]
MFTILSSRALSMNDNTQVPLQFLVVMLSRVECDSELNSRVRHAGAAESGASPVGLHLLFIIPSCSVYTTTTIACLQFEPKMKKKM